MDDKNYAVEFSDTSFWDKLKRVARTVGRELVEKALSMFYAIQDPDTPLWAKGVLISALGYFISPLDVIPDMIPGAGYADDAGAIAAAIGMVVAHIKPEHKQRAHDRANEWFS